MTHQCHSPRDTVCVQWFCLVFYNIVFWNDYEQQTAAWEEITNPKFAPRYVSQKILKAHRRNPSSTQRAGSSNNWKK